MEHLKDRVAIVTGGATGIGLAIATKLVERGVRVALLSRAAVPLERAAQELAARFGRPVAAFPCDVRDSAAVSAAVAQVVTAFGRIDILVNNAGLGVTARVEDCTDEQWDLVLDTNLRGTFLMCRAVIPHLKARRDGFILNVASQAALHGYAEAGPYCASKYAIVGLGEALQKELKGDGIIVHSLCPALVQVPAPGDEADHNDGVLQTEDVAEAALFVLSRPARVKIHNLGLYHSSWSPD